MVSVVGILISLGLVLVGGALALAGRKLHDLFVSTVGFLIGFGPFVFVTFVQGRSDLFDDGLLAGLIATVILLGIAVVAGGLTMALFWWVYRFAIMLPGYLLGGAIGAAVFFPVESGWELLGIFLIASFVGTLFWMIHQLFIAVETAAIGSVLVGIGIYTGHPRQLPIFADPGRLLTEPAGVLVDTAAASTLFVLVVLGLFVTGLVTQLTPGNPALFLFTLLHPLLAAAGQAVGVAIPSPEALDSDGVGAAAVDMPAAEADDYRIVEVTDRSLPYGKRLQATVVVVPPGDLTEATVRDRLPAIVERIREAKLPESALNYEQWAGDPASVVTLDLFDQDAEELVPAPENSHLVCRAKWVDPEADADLRPDESDPDEIHEGIRIDWGSRYAPPEGRATDPAR